MLGGYIKSMIGEIFGVLLLGLVAGAVGKLLLPGKDPGGFVATIFIGIAGAFIGWAIFTFALGIGDPEVFDFSGIVGAIIGVMILLGLYRVFARGDGRGED